MPRLNILTSTLRHIEVDKQIVEELNSARTEALKLYEFFLQYSLFVKSISDFKKGMYSMAINIQAMPSEEYFKTSSIFIEAENALMTVCASFVKFAELLPSLLSYALPFDNEIKRKAKREVNDLYDAPDGKYRLICELRNAIIHNKVVIMVSHGGSKKIFKQDGVVKLGYFLNFDTFLTNSIFDKKPNKKLLLSERKDVLCSHDGHVDLVSAISDAAKSFYRQILAGYIKTLSNRFGEVKANYIEILTSNGLVTDAEIDRVHIECSGNTVFSSTVLGRVETIINSVVQPVTATCITIAPTNLK